VENRGRFPHTHTDYDDDVYERATKEDISIELNKLSLIHISEPTRPY